MGPWDPGRIEEGAGDTAGRGVVGNTGARRQQEVVSLLEIEHLFSVVFSLQQWRCPENTLWVLWVLPP